MDFINERYVRIYTRDTVTWKLLCWQARTVFLHLLRKVDRSGVLELDDGGLDALCAVLELPIDVVEPGIGQLLDKRSLVRRGTTLCVPRFLEAQECTKSGALRQREYRERRRHTALKSDDSLRNVDKSDDSLRVVTKGDVTVTVSDSFLPIPSLPDPGVTERDESKRNVTDRRSGYRYLRSALDPGQLEVFDGDRFVGVVEELPDGSLRRVEAA